MTYPADEETFNARVSPEWIKEGHLNAIQQFLKRIQDFLGYGGRLHDKTGLVIPVGVELGYTGETAPSGWLLEDGMRYNGTADDYIDLWNVIGLKYGGTGQADFAVPDRRGFFVRGWTNIPVKSFVPGDVDIDDDTIIIEEGLYNRIGFPVRFTTDDTLPVPFVINTTYYLAQAIGGELEFSTTWQNAIDGVIINITNIGSGTSYIHPYNEEDAVSRIISAKGGASGADLGSYQHDALQGHYHEVKNLNGDGLIKREERGTGTGNVVRNTTWSTYRFNARDIYDDPSHGVAKVALETRVRNVYTNFIIKR